MNREARSSQRYSDKSASLVYCEATFKVRLTFREVEKFHYKNLHFVLFSFFFFISHNSLMKAHKNIEKITTIFHFARRCAFSYLDIRLATTLLATAANTDKHSIHDAIFIPSDSLPR